MNTMILKLDRRVGINLMYIVLAVLIFMRYGLEINIPSVLLACLCYLIISVGNNDEILALCLCCIPLYTAFSYSYVVLYASIVLIVKNIKRIKLNFTVIIILAIFIWEALHAYSGTFSIKHLILTMVPFIFLLVVQSISRTKLNYQYITKKFVYFVLLVGINLFVRTVMLYQGSVMAAIRQMGRLGVIDENASTIGGQINPNTYGIICVIAIAVLLQNMLYGKKKRKDYLCLFGLIILGILTLSRTYVVLLCITFSLFVIGQRGGINKKIKIVGSIVGIILIGALVLLVFFPTTLETYGGRWGEEDLSNGRLTIMKDSAEVIWTQPLIYLFGLGLENYHEEVLQYVSTAPHDAINEIIMVWGVPGLIIFVWLMIYIVKSANNINHKMNLINYIPLIILVVKAVSGHWITSGYTKLLMTVIYLSLVTELDSKKTNNGIYHVND